MQRTAWTDLPAALTWAVEARTGRILEARTATAGENSPLAAFIRSESGTTFVKGIPADHRRVITQSREAAVTPFVQGISPALLWQFNEAGWTVLGYAYVEGRHADYRPGSPDLDALVHLMTALGKIKIPGDPLFKRAEDRWKTYVATPEEATLFAGDTLAHSDWAPDNVLVSADQAWLIDWAWPTLSAPWLDAASWILRLIAAGGHTPREAELTAFRVPAFEASDPDHVDAFAAANVRLWTEIANSNPTTWTKEMAQAAWDWSQHRRPRATSA
ncbi:hypothetical protein [Amycolatopsis saalfeldensis]|uniref:Phosphotransferase enzyme family protein n=1 Tax=Amycolatopsis saalfeldensis TaxID=394193 RepID=A0A1H8Y349_9PSEU|nr:hypothetical protein [Amycolatopsis saalfeldensis]SEP46492.1 hypothetical protein SAMN04489732_110268 [Amycolatopsis saalfeldensis]